MKTKAARKSALWNGVLVAAILCVLAGGLMTVGSLKGWFDRDAGGETAAPGENGSAADQGVTVTEMTGSANIYRGGLAYALKEDNRLRDGDTVETLNRSGVTVLCGGATVRLDANSRAAFTLAESGETVLSLEAGCAYAELDGTRCLLVNGERVTAEDAAVLATANYGSSLLGVLQGEAEFGGKTVRSGERASLLGEEQGGLTVQALSPEALSSFELDCVRKSARALCISGADVEALEARREAERRQALEAAFLSESDEERIRELREEQEAAALSGDGTAADGSAAAAGGTDEDSEQFLPVCTIEIRCDTILNHMEDLTEGKSGYVPANGTILSASKVSFHEGDTAFDVLKKACELAGIQLEFSWTPLYNSYYIEGINNLYEFDCGEQSGWMYKVNGWFPNYGCSSYRLEDGDVMVWCFTCQGLGADVGGTVY